MFVAHSSYALKFLSIEELKDKDYAVIGDGDYVVKLLELVKGTHGTMPSVIYTRRDNPRLEGCRLEPESNIAQSDIELFVLGTNLFQLEIIDRVSKWIPTQAEFVDVLIGRGDIHTQFHYRQPVPQSKRYVLFYAINPIENIDHYLRYFFTWLQNHQMDVVIRHPLQRVETHVIENAEGVIIWNGTMSIYDSVKTRLMSLDIPFTFVECGFFPQHEFFYFDRKGINTDSQLSEDDLEWISDDHLLTLHEKRETFRASITSMNKPPLTVSLPEDYIFVPLQVPTDTNIVNNSRFSRGMQEFIDYIEALYPNENIVFKAHPKDTHASTYQYQHGHVSSQHTLLLIEGAKLVHGINSSVLFEAALLGKEVKCEGHCLLSVHNDKPDKLLAAMIYRQFHTSDTAFSREKLERFSYLGYSCFG
ncbi:capsule biosynthesis protein [Aestuariibacter sp. AA17]|uniref:Capsule biosynthesis protein n=1 Tax=Fluctibacter corallii TaxID=2984329 RepID=A0ABT3AAW4_9ALTE|nr:capsule biosynthesis protein [Aestuariibacter sp. AA17]MCV2885451.1 capsule biosynthesis protein [Aestuariibacter sp. AA17]